MFFLALECWKYVDVCVRDVMNVVFSACIMGARVWEVLVCSKFLSSVS